MKIGGGRDSRESVDVYIHNGTRPLSSVGCIYTSARFVVLFFFFFFSVSVPIPRYFTIVKHVRSADQTVLIAFGRAKREAPVATMTETAAVPTIRTYHMVSPTGPVFFPPPSHLVDQFTSRGLWFVRVSVVVAHAEVKIAVTSFKTVGLDDWARTEIKYFYYS